MFSEPSEARCYSFFLLINIFLLFLPEEKWEEPSLVEFMISELAWSTTNQLVTVLSCNEREEILDKVGSEIKEGKIIVFPTDTVYGLGTSPNSREGVERCFSIKERGKSKAFPVLYSSLDEVERVAILDHRAKSLSSEFWPGS